MMDNIAYIFV